MLCLAKYETCLLQCRDGGQDPALAGGPVLQLLQALQPDQTAVALQGVPGQGEPGQPGQPRPHVLQLGQQVVAQVWGAAVITSD